MRIASRGFAAWLVVAFSSACGGSPPVAASAPIAHKNPIAIAQKAPALDPPPTPYFVLIETEWVGHHVRAPDHDVDDWAADPASSKTIAPNIRHILISVSSDAKPKEVAAARKRANAALARIKHGEDFAKVADEVSDDHGAQRAGGVLPGDDLSIFVDPFRDAATALAPGEFTKKLVRSAFGFHIIKKNLVDEDAKRSAFQRAHAKTAAFALAQLVAASLQHTDDPSRAVNDAIASVLDETALDDPPQLTGFPATAAENAMEDPACTQARSVVVTDHALSGMLELERGHGFVVTKALGSAFRPAVEPQICMSLERISTDEMRKLIERVEEQRRQESGSP